MSTEEPAAPPPPSPAAVGTGTGTRKLLLLYVGLPPVAMAMVWIWVKSERGVLRDRGAIACNQRKHDEVWCKEAADRHHERCVELTFSPATRTSSASFDTNGYVECLDVEPAEYWRLSAARALERRAPLLPSGPSYH